MCNTGFQPTPSLSWLWEFVAYFLPSVSISRVSSIGGRGSMTEESVVPVTLTCNMWSHSNKVVALALVSQVECNRSLRPSSRAQWHIHHLTSSSPSFHRDTTFKNPHVMMRPCEATTQCEHLLLISLKTYSWKETSAASLGSGSRRERGHGTRWTMSQSISIFSGKLRNLGYNTHKGSVTLFTAQGAIST